MKGKIEEEEERFKGIQGRAEWRELNYKNGTKNSDDRREELTKEGMKEGKEKKEGKEGKVKTKGIG